MVIFTATLAIPGVVPIMWILKYSKDLTEYMQTYNQLMVTCPHAITFNHLTSQPSTQLHVLPTQN